MRTRTLLGLLVGSLCLSVLVPLSARALGMNVLKIVDLNGNVLTDIDGNPTIATLAQSPIPGGHATIGFDLTVPDTVPFSTAGVVRLVEQLPDPVTHVAPVADEVIAQLLSSSGGAPAFLSVVLRAHTPPWPSATCQQVGIGSCLLETGDFQDVTAALFPGKVLSFRILVQSDPTPIPEPGTLMLLGFGLTGVAALGSRRAGASAGAGPRA